MIWVQSSSGIQIQLQFAIASCKCRGRELQTQMWISWSTGTVGSPTSWPSPAGTPVGACTVGSALLQVARVQLEWWIQHQRRGIGTHQWSDLNGIWMEMLHYAKTHKTVTLPPPQSACTVSLNDPFKTSVPAKYEWTTFRALLGVFYNKENLCMKIIVLSGTSQNLHLILYYSSTANIQPYKIYLI